MSKLSIREKVGFSVGEFGGSGLWQVMMIFLPAFYTDVFGVSAAITGTMFLVVRFSDAIADCVMGLVADRTNTRWGKFRPYILWGAVPFGLLTVALFAAPALSPNGKVIYAYATYIPMMLVYTVVMIPFSALSGVMTADPAERTSLNSYRFIGAFAASFIVQGAIPLAVPALGQGDSVVGYRWTMALFAVLAVALFYVTFRTTQERVPTPAQPGGQSVKRDLLDLVQNKPWLVIVGVTLLSLIYISIRSAAQVYYFKYAVENEKLIGPFMMAGTAATMVGIAFTGILTRWFGKKGLYIGSLVLTGIGSLGFLWVDPKNVTVLFALQIFFSFAGAPAMPLLWSMMADVADYSEWKTGRRATGLVFSASTFAIKAGVAVGGAIAMYVLAMTGYQANVAQTPDVIEGMKQMIGLYPAIGALLSAVIMAFYGLNTARLTEISNELATRRGQSAAAPAA